jgi:hypothetical protein
MEMYKEHPIKSFDDINYAEYICQLIIRWAKDLTIDIDDIDWSEILI